MLLVHCSIVQPFLQRLSSAIDALKIGRPWEDGVRITPLPGPHRNTHMDEALRDAQAQGTRLLNAIVEEHRSRFVHTGFLF